MLDGVDALGPWLAQRENVSEVRIDNHAARFLYAGGAPEAAELLKAMIAAGFRVTAFGRRRQSLEDVFMQVTKGLVQ